ncbi:hypothetical protein FN846DRAFT_911263 [Sphaerosporella brunnea]|uniref:Uncharacterized protein n=1 Tax=Sphaerosporella brunnea TaxID=1250544 RepID=A0A5J5ELC3_9PEZI|nr:hypothetical protein FN846DRAFT_911263 [Sphaerosporella brunnea]
MARSDEPIPVLRVQSGKYWDTVDGQREVEDACSSEDEDAAQSEGHADGSAAGQGEVEASRQSKVPIALASSERVDAAHNIGHQHPDKGDAEGMDAEKGRHYVGYWLE